MADEKTNAPPPDPKATPQLGAEVAIGDKGAVTADAGGAGTAGAKPAVTSPSPGEQQGGAESGEAAAAEGTDASAKVEALPAFDASKPEVVAQYDAKYQKPGADGKPTGEVNLKAFGDDFRSLTNEARKAGKWLSDDAAKYVKTKFGLSDSDIATIGQGELARQSGVANAIYAKSGGKEGYDAMLAWARGDGKTAGAYTPAQQAAFNAAVADGTDDAARDEQIELLAARYNGANPKRPVRTVKDATQNLGGVPVGTKVEPYESEADYRKDWKVAVTTNDTAALAINRARWQASAQMPWRKGGR